MAENDTEVQAAKALTGGKLITSMETKEIHRLKVIKEELEKKLEEVNRAIKSLENPEV